MSVEFKDGAVCFAGGELHYAEKYKGLVKNATGYRSKMSDIVSLEDFQLNTIKQGDCVKSSELNSWKRYNDVVEVFKLSGFKPVAAVLNFNSTNSKSLTCVGGELWRGLVAGFEKRKLTCQQIMAIGELKRLMNERDENKLKPLKATIMASEAVFGVSDRGEYYVFKDDPELKPIKLAGNSVSKVNRDIEAFKDGNKYHREITGLDGTKTIVDVYRVLDAFKTGCSATDHAIKKMLCAGLRGHKDKMTDYGNAIESLQKAKSLLVQKEAK